MKSAGRLPIIFPWDRLRRVKFTHSVTGWSGPLPLVTDVALVILLVHLARAVFMEGRTQTESAMKTS